MKKQAKKVTLDSLAAIVEAGFGRMDKGFKDAKEDNESLARMVSVGFEHTATKAGFAVLENSQEEMKLLLDNTAHKFEVKELERRVKRLEARAGLRHSIQH